MNNEKKNLFIVESVFQSLWFGLVTTKLVDTTAAFLSAIIIEIFKEQLA